MRWKINKWMSTIAKYGVADAYSWMSSIHMIICDKNLPLFYVFSSIVSCWRKEHTFLSMSYRLFFFVILLRQSVKDTKKISFNPFVWTISVKCYPSLSLSISISLLKLMFSASANSAIGCHYSRFHNAFISYK